MGFLAKNTGKNVSLADSDQIIERQATRYHLPRMVQMTRLEDFFETKRREELEMIMIFLITAHRPNTLNVHRRSI